MSETPDISKLTKRQREALLNYEGKRFDFAGPWAPKTMASLKEIGLAEEAFSWLYNGARYRLTDAGWEAMRAVLRSELGQQ